MAFSGEVFSAFDNPEAVTYKVSKAGNKYLNSLWPQLTANIPTYQALWEKFRSGLDRAGSEIAALKPGIANRLSSLFSGFIDPFTTSSQLQARDIGAVNDITGRVGDYATRATKLANTMLGGGRPPGSAASSFLTNDVTRATLPLYQTVLAGNPAASAQLEADRRAQLAAKMGIIGNQLSLPLVGTELPLMSADALRGMSSHMTGAARELIDQFRNNMLGAGMEEGILGQIGRAGADVASSYGSMYGKSYGDGAAPVQTFSNPQAGMTAGIGSGPYDLGTSGMFTNAFTSAPTSISQSYNSAPMGGVLTDASGPGAYAY